MGYYCTVPQCTSLAGKTKNVKFHRFPRDVTMADKWNVILKRGKPYTKYSKVCSLHFTQSDYNVTTMGQWKTLSKDAVPSQNLPRLNPDGSVMIIRKSRTVKYREPGVKKEQESGSDKPQEKWAQSSSTLQNVLAPCHSPQHVHVSVGSNTAQRAEESNLAYRLQTINALANNLTSPSPALTASPQGNTTPQKTPKKQDAIMQTDPCSEEEENPLSTSFSDHSDNSFQSENVDYPNMSGSSHYQKEEYDSQVNRSSQMGQRETPGQTGLHQIQQDAQRSQSQNGQSQSGQTQGQNGPVQSHIGQRDGQMTDNYEIPKDYTKSNEDFNNALESANKYALERKYEKSMESGYQQKMQYNKVQDMYPSDYNRDFQEKQPDYNGRNEVYNGYQNGYADTVDILRNQQHNIQMLQEPHRLGEGPGLFDGHIKQETDLPHEDLYGQKEESDIYAEQRRQLMLQQRMLDQLQPHVKTEPDPLGGCDQSIPADSPYYQNGHNNIGMGYYEQFSRQPGPELLIAKQNALAAHTQIWQNSIRRPFFYSENVHSSGSQLLHRYEDLSRILQ